MGKLLSAAAQGYTLEVGSASPGFEEGLIGMELRKSGKSKPLFRKIIPKTRD